MRKKTALLKWLASAQEVLTLAQAVGVHIIVARISRLHTELQQSRWKKEDSFIQLRQMLVYINRETTEAYGEREMVSKGYNFENMAKKRMSASALFLNEQGKVLIVKPTYMPDWLLPGGIVEKNESPRHACLREIKEELNIEMSLTKLLCIEYHSDDPQQTESIQFVFYGELLTESQIYSIQLPKSELSEYRFSTQEEALQLLSCKLARRLPYCLQALEENIILYLEDGKLPN